MTKFMDIRGSLVALVVVAACVSAAATPQQPNAPRTAKMSEGLDVTDDDNNLENMLYNYDLSPVRRADHESSVNAAKKIKSSSYLDLERESSNKQQKASAGPKEVLADSERSGSPNSDLIRKIAFNSREVRLVGPNQKEVEMKDDMATKVVVALENLQKEASDVWSQVNDKLDKGWTDLKRSEVWGQVNDKLDKGWTDLKTMVEGVVTPSAKAKRQT